MVAICPAAPAEAKSLYTYDLDSLVYMSEEIVEGDMVRKYSDKNIALTEVKVTKVYKGAVKQGQALAVVDIWHYAKSKKNDRNTVRLDTGDHLVLFLARVRGSTSGQPIPADAVMYAPSQGGLRLVDSRKVFSFWQWDNPGPYVADVNALLRQRTSISIEMFHQELRQSFRDVDQLVPVLKAKEANLDVPRLLKLLADRPEIGFPGRDHISEVACIRLAMMHDPTVLSRALPLANDYHSRDILARGFGTPKGRDYLLAKIADTDEPMDARIRYARILRNTGEVYRSIFTDITETGVRPVGKPDAGNSGYLTRIAQAARANGKHADLCVTLVDCLGWLSLRNWQDRDAPVIADLQGAQAILKEMYAAKNAEPIQFAIECVLARADLKLYEELHSPCGPIISILRAVDPNKYTKPKERSLIFEFSFSIALPLDLDAKLRASVVLVHQGSNKKFVLPSQHASQLVSSLASGAGGSDSVVLPKDLPPGRHHVYYQFTDRGKVISTGHFFAADL